MTPFRLRSVHLLSLALAVLSALLSASAIAGDKARQADRTLDAFFASDWQWRLKQSPEWATSLGDHRYDDRATDMSPSALDARRAYRQQSDKTLRSVNRKALSADRQLSLDLFRWKLDEALALDRLYGKNRFGDHWGGINHMTGVHIGFASTIATTRFETESDYRNYLSRLRGMAQRLDQTVALAREGAAAGWTLPKVTVERVPRQIDRILGNGLETASWYSPFLKMPETINAVSASRLRDEARQVFHQHVNPALGRYRDFVVNDYLPKARDSIAASALPGGMDYYRLAVRGMTTLPLEPEEIHRIGLDEVARIRGRMEAIAREQGFSGTLPEFIKALRARPDQYYSSSEALLDAYLAIGKRADPLMAQLFRTLPRAPWGVRAARPEEQGNPDHYLQAAADGSRAGYYVADVSRPSVRPKYEMTALVLHEAVPGHHTQTARAGELAELPDFRRHSWFVGYGEGWALYAESLGEELGLYRDPLELFGRYTLEIWRAARLVVDTGMHAKNWTRQQAIDYLATATGRNIEDVSSEIDRYIVWPGQALGYKLGEIAIQRMRQRASTALGERFDLRNFHNLILDSGPLPLELLERRVDQWIARGGPT